MEDGVEEVQNTVFADQRSSLGGDRAAEEIEGERERPSGLIHNLISTMVSGTEGDNEEIAEEQNRSGGISGEERNKEEEKESGGLINHLLSNLVSPIMSPGEVNNKSKADEFETEMKQEDKRGGGLFSKSEEGFGGSSSSDGGIFKGLISNVFHQDQDQGGRGEERKIKDVNQGAEVVKSEGGGGLVEAWFQACQPLLQRMQPRLRMRPLFSFTPLCMNNWRS